MTDKEKAIYELAMDHFGLLNQVLKSMEECGELVRALSRYTQKIGSDVGENVVEEIADVQIMINQLTLFFGPERVDQKLKDKLTSLSLRIGFEMAQSEAFKKAKESPQASVEN